MRRSWPLIITALFIVPLICVVVYLVRFVRKYDPAVVGRQLVQAPKDLAEQRAAARRDGIPLEAADVKIAIPPAGQNAADIYNQVALALKSQPANLPAPKRTAANPYGYTPEQIKELRQILADHKDVLALIHRAADTQACVFPRDWSKGAELMLPELGGLRADVRLITAESYLMALDGHYEDAIANQTQGRRIAAHAAADRTTTGYLVAIALDAITLRGLEDILTMAGPNKKLDEQVGKAISDNPIGLSLRRAMTGEFLMSEYELQRVRREGPKRFDELNGAPHRGVTKTHSALEQKAFSLEIDAAEAEYLRHMRSAYAVADEPGPQRHNVFGSALDVKRSSGDTPEQLTNKIVLSMFMPSFPSLEKKETGIRAEEAVAQAGAAVLAAKSRTGVFPESLPGSFTDPCTGKPLGYRRDGKGFVVYSYGASGAYDGKPGAKHGVEFFFRYPASP